VALDCARHAERIASRSSLWAAAPKQRSADLWRRGLLSRDGVERGRHRHRWSAPHPCVFQSCQLSQRSASSVQSWQVAPTPVVSVRALAADGLGPLHRVRYPTPAFTRAAFPAWAASWRASPRKIACPGLVHARRASIAGGDGLNKV